MNRKISAAPCRLQELMPIRLTRAFRNSGRSSPFARGHDAVSISGQNRREAVSVTSRPPVVRGNPPTKPVINQWMLRDQKCGVRVYTERDIIQLRLANAPRHTMSHLPNHSVTHGSWVIRKLLVQKRCEYIHRVRGVWHGVRTCSTHCDGVTCVCYATQIALVLHRE